MSSESRIQLEEYLKNLDVEEIGILDIGGSANPVKGRTKSWKVHNYKILDNSLEKEWHDKWRKPDIVADINRYVDNNDRFDLIFMLEVMEYIWNPVIAIDNCCRFLRAGGRLIMSSHFIYPVHNPKEHDYLRLTKKGLIKMFKVAGFRKWKFIPRTARNPQLLNTFYSNEGMRSAKGEDHSITGHIAEVTK